MMAVLDVDSEAEFDKKISSAGDALVIIDYSTTWCGPCKVSTMIFRWTSAWRVPLIALFAH
jgi:thiol-disulfide isomerase/thioredoxin